MENKTNELEKLNETMRDILKVLVSIYVSLEKKRDEKLDEEDILYPFLEELPASSIQVCADCSHFDPKAKVCDQDGTHFEGGCEHNLRCLRFNQTADK